MNSELMYKELLPIIDKLEKQDLAKCLWCVEHILNSQLPTTERDKELLSIIRTTLYFTQ